MPIAPRAATERRSATGQSTTFSWAPPVVAIIYLPATKRCAANARRVDWSPGSPMPNVAETSSVSPPPLTALSEEERMFQDAVRRFARERIGPYVREMDAAAIFRKDLLHEMFELGLMGIEIPEEYGGQGGSFFQAVLAVEALAAVDPSAAVIVDVQNTIANNVIIRWGADDQKRRYLPKLARELWITNAAESGLFLLFANANPEAGHRGITCFLVERDFPGFQVGKKEDKLGIRASSTCELILDDCRVPAGNVLGEVGKGYKIAIETLNEGRIAIGAQMTGLAQGALDHAIAYAKQRHQFGKPIAEFQGVQFELAQMATEVEAARLLVYNAARLRDSGHPYVTEAAMAKYFASQVAGATATRAC